MYVCMYVCIHKYIQDIAKKSYVLRKMQRALISMESWRERWKIKIKEEKSRAIYLSHCHIQLEVFYIRNKVNFCRIPREISWCNF